MFHIHFYDIDSFFEYINIQEQKFCLRYFSKWYFFGLCCLPVLVGVAQFNLNDIIFSQLESDSPILSAGAFGNIGGNNLSKITSLVPGIATAPAETIENLKQHVSTKEKIEKKKLKKRTSRGLAIQDGAQVETERVKKESSNFLQHCPLDWTVEQVSPRNKYHHQRHYLAKDKSGEYFTGEGNFGSYKEMLNFRLRITELMKNETRIELCCLHGEHIANDKISKMCGVSRDRRLCILSNRDLNHYKEQSSYYNPVHRDFTDKSLYQGTPMHDILLESHLQDHKELFSKLEANTEYMEAHSQHHEMVKAQYM